MSIENIRITFVLICLVFLAVFILKEKTDVKLNWALFYSFIWMLFALPITNFLCVQFDFWEFLIDENLIKIPYDILFIWLFLWMLPFFIFKGKYTLITSLILFWIDILVMPILGDYEIVKLNENWIVGEFILLIIVFAPSYFWAKFSYNNNNTAFRAIMQVATMSLFLLIIVPFTVKIFETNNFQFNNFSMVWFQVILIIAFPSLIAVIDLVEKGKGTPFPYDKTKNLVTSGVYAYIKNPIQWSFTVLFIPLSLYHQSYLLFVGFIVSLAYTIGVSNPQEYDDMKMRFGEKWSLYKENVPSWYFLWKPSQIQLGKIYFKKNCSQCEDVRSWFERRKPLNLQIEYAENYLGDELLQVTYEDHLGQEFKSVTAIAYALEHINLGYASLGWFMRFPIINYVLQTIIDALGFSPESKECKF